MILVDGVRYPLQLEDSDPLLTIDTYASRTEQRFIRVEAWGSAAVVHVLPEPTPKEVTSNPAAAMQWVRDKKIRYPSGTQVDIDGSFSPNFNNFGNPGQPQTIMAAYLNNSTWFARNSSGWQSWNGVVTDLPTISTISLPHGSAPITVSSLSQTLTTGSYQVFFGYKWQDPAGCSFVVINQQPISITIN